MTCDVRAMRERYGFFTYIQIVGYGSERSEPNWALNENGAKIRNPVKISYIHCSVALPQQLRSSSFTHWGSDQPKCISIEMLWDNTEMRQFFFYYDLTHFTSVNHTFLLVLLIQEEKKIRIILLIEQGGKGKLIVGEKTKTHWIKCSMRLTATDYTHTQKDLITFRCILKYNTTHTYL